MRSITLFRTDSHYDLELGPKFGKHELIQKAMFVNMYGKFHKIWVI